MSLAITKKRMLIYAAIVVAGVVLYFSGQSSEETSTAVARVSADSAGPRQNNLTLSSNAAAFLTRLAHRTTDTKTAEALFASRTWVVPVPPPPPPPAPGPPPPPVAPPLPFTFLGSYAAQGDQATFFLARGDRIYDVKLGDAIDADYTLVAVDGANMIFNYKPLNARQSLALGGT
jgi:hypothetical protein